MRQFIQCVRAFRLTPNRIANGPLSSSKPGVAPSLAGSPPGLFVLPIFLESCLDVSGHHHPALSFLRCPSVAHRSAVG
ncbi:protein of unknown function [Nitrospira defluvii]|uniref:Uncharacterized protein n=1 Tax=Nitrospira defluvii TaxID=330214 RepID=D8PJ04_9BACT|nr:protein of unknown function [Nitrospira defluvii]